MTFETTPEHMFVKVYLKEMSPANDTLEPLKNVFRDVVQMLSHMLRHRNIQPDTIAKVWNALFLQKKTVAISYLFSCILSRHHDTKAKSLTLVLSYQYGDSHRGHIYTALHSRYHTHRSQWRVHVSRGAGSYTSAHGESISLDTSTSDTLSYKASHVNSRRRFS